jgi:hypothetical protein
MNPDHASIHPSAWKGNSAKFTVASSPSDAAATTRQQHVRHPVCVKLRRLGTIRYTIVYQGLQLIT